MLYLVCYVWLMFGWFEWLSVFVLLVVDDDDVLLLWCYVIKCVWWLFGYFYGLLLFMLFDMVVCY